METISPTSIKLPLAGTTLPGSTFICNLPVGRVRSDTLQVKESDERISDSSPLISLKNNSFGVDLQESELFGESINFIQSSPAFKSFKFDCNGDLIDVGDNDSDNRLNEISKDGDSSNSSFNLQKDSRVVKCLETPGPSAIGTTNKQSSYIKNCLIRSSSCGNNYPHASALAQIMSKSSLSSNAIIINTNSNCSSTSNLSSSSGSPDYSSPRKENTGVDKNKNLSINHIPSIVTKKGRSKLLLPLRHGPQQCLVCNKVFGNASALAKHKLTHSDERKYICGMCSKAFKRQDHLNGHMMTHRNKKPYECKFEGCGKSYCDARSLRRHSENHHGTGIVAGATKSNNGPRTYLKTIVDASALKAATEGDLTDIQLPIKIGVTVLSPTNSSSSTCGTSSLSLSDSSPKQANSETASEDEFNCNRQIEQNNITLEAKTVPSASNGKLMNLEVSQLLQVESKDDLNQQMNANNEQICSGANVVNSVQSTAGVDICKENTSNKQFPINNRLLNIVKIDQKPVECNLCHRKFKNVPALNGHMRLHGGYFKKDAENKKNDKKEGNSQPLQTASLGVRALIEEKIINKRCKEQTKAAFIIPSSPNISLNTSGNHFSQTLPPAMSILENKKKLETKQPFYISQDFEVLNRNHGNEQSPIGRSKESTLVELLKRSSAPMLPRTSFSEENNNLSLSILNSNIPDMNFASLNSVQINSPSESKKTIQCDFQGQSTAIISLSDGTSFPLSLSQNGPGVNGDFFTVSYANESGQGFEDAEIFKLSNPNVLLTDVENFQLLNDSSSIVPSVKVEHSENYLQTGICENKLGLLKEQFITNSQSPASIPITDLNTYDSAELLLQNNTSIQSIDMMEAKKLLQINELKPDKECSLISSLPNLLDYPTPPSSHENLTHSSPFDCNNQTNENSNNYFKFGSEFLLDSGVEFFRISSENDLSEKEKILKLKNELEDSSFEVSIKVEELLNTPGNDSECDLRDFSSSNLQFLDYGDQEFLNNSQEITSPFSESFFPTNIPNENQTTIDANDEEIDNKSAETVNANFISELTFQSQMMPNSDDPLLSSSPKEFGQQRQFIPSIQSILPQDPNCQITIQNQQTHEVAGTQMSQNISVPPNKNNSEDLKTNNMEHQKDSSMNYESKNVFEKSQTHFNFDENNRCTNNQKETADSSNSSSTKTDDEGIFLAPPPCIKKEDLSDTNFQSNSILKRRLRPNEKEDTIFNSGNLRFFPPVKYSSKLRKPSRTHYTPPPMLNPDRVGYGLYCNIRKKQTSSLIGFDSLLMEEDHSGLVEFSDESKVNLGSAYQAQIPSYRTTRNRMHDEAALGAELMWDPTVLEDEKSLSRFVDLSKSTALPIGSHPEEFALKTLLKYEGNTATAVLSLLQTRSTALHMQWMAPEIELFLKGLNKYGKNFTRIAKDIKTKSCSDCIQMYYFWKKLCVGYKDIYLKPKVKTEPSTGNESLKPFACDVTDCFASFACKAALHSHSRIHTYGKVSNTHTIHSSISTSSTSSLVSSSYDTSTSKIEKTNNNKNNNVLFKLPNDSTSNTSSNTNTNNNTNNNTNINTNINSNNNIHSNNNTCGTIATPGISTNRTAPTFSEKSPNNQEDKYPCKVCGK